MSKGRAAGHWFVRSAAVVWTLASLCAQQSGPGDADAEFTALLTAARASYARNDWDRSAEAYQHLLTTAHDKGSALWEARGLLGLGRVDNERARYADAKRRALEALATFERLNAPSDVGDANITLGVTLFSIGDSAGAQMAFERAVTLYRITGNRRAEVEANLRLASTLQDKANVVAMLAQLHPEAQALGDKHLEGEILHAWGDELFMQSIYQPAIEKLEAAAALFRALPSPTDLGTTYNSLGRLYRAHGQPAAALEFQLKALEIHETLNTPRLLIQSLNAVAVASEVAGKIDQAQRYYERALAEAERTQVASYISFMRANFGFFLVQRDRDVARGRDLLETAIAAGAADTIKLRYTQLAEAELKLGRFQSALDAVDIALKACRGPEDCIGAHATRGRTRLAMGDEAGALADQKDILAIVETMHQTLAVSDLLKQNFQRLWEEAYSLAIELHFRRGEIREALETAELSRSRAFLDLMASRELARTTGLEPPRTAAALRSVASAPPPTLDALTAIAARLQSTLLAYWVSGSHVYAWVLSPDGRVRSGSVAISRSKLDDLIQSTLPFARAPQGSSVSPAIATRGDMQIAVSPKNRRAWRALYDVLIAPIERELPRRLGARLTIVPHGPLLTVPFAALRDPQGRYLIERYTIHSVPAGAVLQFTAAYARRDSRAGAMLLVGDPASPPKVSGEPALPRLAGANDEIRAIARLLPSSHATVLAGRAAIEPRVRAALPGKAVIHFATHGIVRDSNPLASFLALGTTVDPLTDGQLTADKIYGLDLDADLIVLSACRSGGGVITGDGIAGFARAFFYAGAPSVIVSVWDVADQTASRLLPVFYRRWLNGADKAAALRAAQLSLVRSLRAGRVKITLPVGTFVLPEDPAFWAAFVLLGEPD